MESVVYKDFGSHSGQESSVGSTNRPGTRECGVDPVDAAERRHDPSSRSTRCRTCHDVPPSFRADTVLSEPCTPSQLSLQVLSYGREVWSRREHPGGVGPPVLFVYYCTTFLSEVEWLVYFQNPNPKKSVATCKIEGLHVSPCFQTYDP